MIELPAATAALAFLFVFTEDAAMAETVLFEFRFIANISFFIMLELLTACLIFGLTAAPRFVTL